MTDTLTLCDLCGLPANCNPVIRMTFIDESNDINPIMARIAIAPEGSDSPTAICLRCIRGIKAIPFSDIEAATKVLE